MVNKRGVYRFHMNYGRHAKIQGIFLAYEYDVRDLVGVTVYFGEIAGKHTEVIRKIDYEDVILVTDDPTAVHIFERYDLECGINPFDYSEDE